MDWLGALSHVLAAAIPAAVALWLGRDRAELRRQLAARPVERHPTGQHEALRPKILVVDDEPTVRSIVARACVSERINVTVHSAASVEEAIAYARVNRYAKALLDVRLPGGVVADVVAALNEGPELLFFSGDPASAEQAAHDHGGRVVDKFDVDAITEALRAGLDVRAR